MAYVFIHGRGLAGPPALACGDPREGAPVRGIGGRSLGVRGMQRGDAGLPQSVLNDGVNGLGGLGTSPAPDVEAGLAQLVRTAQDSTASVVDDAVFLARPAAREWAASVVGFTQSLQATLTAKRNGVSFYAREPQAAARLLSTAAGDLRQMVDDFRTSTNTLVPLSVANAFDMVITGIVAGLVRSADAAIRAAIDEAGKLPPLPGGLPGWAAPAIVGLILMGIVAHKVM